MANNGKEILEKQNQVDNLVLLLARREVYSEAKNIQNLSIVLVSVVPVLIALGGYVSPKILANFPNIMSGYGIIAVIIEFFLIYFRDKKKELASSIQENFDKNVFGISKNEILGALDIDDSTLLKYKNKIDNGANIEKLKDWHSKEIIEIKTNVAILFCQRANVYYDYNIRNKYIIIVFLFLISTCLLIFLLGFFKDVKLSEFLLKIVYAYIPILIFSLNEIKNQKEAIKGVEDLQKIINNYIDKVGLNSNVNEVIIRQIQDRIYNNRKINPLIPDLLYEFLRDKKNNNLEQTMNFSIARKIQEIKEQENTTQNGA